MKFGLQIHDPQPTVADLDMTATEVVDLLANFFETSRASSQGTTFQKFPCSIRDCFCRKMISFFQLFGSK